MLHLYLLSSILALSFTYLWYSLYGFQYFWRWKLEDIGVPADVKSKPIRDIPTYIWDMYNYGVNTSEIDVVKGIFPIYQGTIYKCCTYQNHRGKELEFNIPKARDNEIFVKAEVRIMTTIIRNMKVNIQIYLKRKKWIFLAEEKVSNVKADWISFQVTPDVRKIKSGSLKFLILIIFQDEGIQLEHNSLEPILLLSYLSEGDWISRRKRSLPKLGDYDEMGSAWEDEPFSNKIPRRRVKSSCRRKPLYIKFSDIDYDSWIVAPTGYEAFQCVGKCTLPVSEQLSPTKHAILQTLLHNISPSKAPRACCVPTKLEPISILYVDRNGVLTYRFRYHDMVVTECGCR